jgi:hypothetical protein
MLSRVIIEQRLSDIELALKRQEELIYTQRDALRCLRDFINSEYPTSNTPDVIGPFSIGGSITGGGFGGNAGLKSYGTENAFSPITKNSTATTSTSITGVTTTTTIPTSTSSNQSSQLPIKQSSNNHIVHRSAIKSSTPATGMIDDPRDIQLDSTTTATTSLMTNMNTNRNNNEETILPATKRAKLNVIYTIYKYI